MTNLLHCAELLHGAEKERALGMEGLIAWLSERRRSAPKSDEYQLRLETDEDAVTIITIHRSKGLQFPVVFCPFLWEGVREGRAADFVFHDPGNRYVPTLDIGSGDAGHRALLLREELAENMRLFYVALTRARYRCCWTWGFINTAETSAPAYTLFRPEAGDAAALMDELKSAFIASGHEGIRGLLLALERKSKGNIRVRGFPGLTAERYTPYDAAPGALESRRFTGAVRKDWKVASFTSLAAASFAGTEDPDRDEAGSLPPPAARRPDGEDISLFPAGAAAGNCIHEMLQKLDFERLEDPGSEKLIRDALDRHGFERRWTPVIKEMLRKTLSAPLDPGDPGLVLEKVACADRLTEMEFYFPLKRIRMPGLADVFASRLDAPWRDEFCARLRGLPAESVRGMARGFIDLVFRHAGRYYIVDWKSNLLGGSPGDYTEGALRSAMMTHLYFLQYHLYAVAVHRYLRLRHPGYRHGDHFGGVYYLFLRGVNPGRSPETGIYRDLPGEGLLEELSRYLSNGEEG
jgi:exodeoxyribonuclease V beta subunit